jgi:pimeloyl-ACP methyl ester carboxylesterase
VAEIIGRLADDRGLGRFPVVGFSGGVPFALACGAVLKDRVSRIAAVAGQGPIDELTDAYAALSSAEREMVSEIRRDPATATELIWEHGQWYPETPLQMLDRPPAAGCTVHLDAAAGHWLISRWADIVELALSR